MIPGSCIICIIAASQYLKDGGVYRMVDPGSATSTRRALFWELIPRLSNANAAWDEAETADQPCVRGVPSPLTGSV